MDNSNNLNNNYLIMTKFYEKPFSLLKTNKILMVKSKIKTMIKLRHHLGEYRQSVTIF